MFSRFKEYLGFTKLIPVQIKKSNVTKEAHCTFWNSLPIIGLDALDALLALRVPQMLCHGLEIFRPALDLHGH